MKDAGKKVIKKKWTYWTAIEIPFAVAAQGSKIHVEMRICMLEIWNAIVDIWKIFIFTSCYFKCNENKIPMPLTKGDYVDVQKAGYLGIRLYARRKTKATIYMFSWMNCVGGFFIFAPTSNNYNFISFACHGRKWNTCVTFTFWFWRHRVLQRSWQAN